MSNPNKFIVISPFTANACGWFTTRAAAADYAAQLCEENAERLRADMDRFIASCQRAGVTISECTRKHFVFYATENTESL